MIQKVFRIASFALWFSVLLSMPAYGGVKKKPAPMPKLEVSGEGVTQASDQEFIEKMRTRLEQFVRKSGFSEKEIGLWIGLRQSGGVVKVASFQGEKQMVPASLSKIVTGAAALHILRPGFKFKTELLADAKPDAAGAVTGPLYFRGGGNPVFVSEDMWFLVNALTRARVKTIGGDIVVDDSRFDDVRFDEDRESIRVDRAYDAPVGALSFNWNSVSVFVRPAAKAGEPCWVVADPENAYIKVRNETRTVAAGSKKRGIAIERRSEKEFSGDVIVVTGDMAVGDSEHIAYKSITQPDLWAGQNLVEFLKQRGIDVRGKVRRGVAPPTAEVLAFHESKPLLASVSDMAKWSNNYVAEMLVKNLAAEDGVKPATMSAGLSRVRKYLETLGWNKDDYVFVNASGFTRENRLSPQQLVKILDHVQTDFSIGPEFMATLPIGGTDGTLRSRMRGSAGEGLVRAKTGLLNGVVGLAGFAGRKDGRLLEFAFVFNGGNREDAARSFFDRLSAQLVDE